jgi:uncharacterized membrane protein YjfL (UPF0719 family)
VINLLLAILLAVFSIYIALWILDKITRGIDEIKELKRGNVAVAIMMAAVLLAVSFIIRSAVANMAADLSAQSLAAAFGID